MSYLKLSIGAVILIAAVPSSLGAQACTGNHVSHGQSFIDASLTFTDGDSGFGGSVGGFTRGQFFGAVSYTRTNFDNSDLVSNNVNLGSGVELPGSGLSVCPALAIGHSWFSGNPPGGDLDGSDIRGGLMIGKSFGEHLMFTPHASASVIHNRLTATFVGASQTFSDTGGVFAAGFSVGGNQFYGGPSVSITTFEGSDPVFSITAEVAF